MNTCIHNNHVDDCRFCEELHKHTEVILHPPGHYLYYRPDGYYMVTTTKPMVMSEIGKIAGVKLDTTGNFIKGPVYGDTGGNA